MTSPISDINWNDSQRQDRFHSWLSSIAPAFQLRVQTLQMASADASFRRYFRLMDEANQSYVVMDAPPDKENNEAFAKVAHLIEQAGLRGPSILNWDRANGFLLLTDLGNKTVLECIDRNQQHANLPYFEQATSLLVAWQLASKPDQLPLYDAALLEREMRLFDQWYLGTHKGLGLDAGQQQVLAHTYQIIIANNLSQPNVYVHRDFMPRNLMVPEPPHARLGVLDFQDAVYGPLSYDIASLMRDAFWSWEEDFVLDVTVRYWEKARKAGLPVPTDFGEFYRAVDWMALQRHLKVAGIFARLTLRDGKPKYLADTPRFIQYIRQTAGRYRELTPLLRLIDQVEGIQTVSGFAYGRI